MLRFNTLTLSYGMNETEDTKPKYILSDEERQAKWQRLERAKNEREINDNNIKLYYGQMRDAKRCLRACEKFDAVLTEEITTLRHELLSTLLPSLYFPKFETNHAPYAFLEINTGIWYDRETAMLKVINANAKLPNAFTVDVIENEEQSDNEVNS